MRRKGIFDGTWTGPNLIGPLVETADYDGDGKADLLWWNRTTGMLFQMLMNGSAAGSTALVYTEPDTGWEVQAGGTHRTDLPPHIPVMH